MLKVEFIFACLFLMLFLSGNGVRILMNTIIRCLFCLVCIYFCNQVILYFGGEISVRINEISMAVSAIFGISGVAALYGLQAVFTFWLV